MISRDVFSAEDLERLAEVVCLSLAGPARIAASILNDTVWHFAPMIVDATGADLKEALRANAEAAERVASATRRLLYVLPREGDGFAGPVMGETGADLQKLLACLCKRADAAARGAGKLDWGMECAGTKDMRDFLGGALPAAFALFFTAGTGAQRDVFVSSVCERLGLGRREPEAIKKAVARFRAASKAGTMSNLPAWMGT